MTRKMSYEDKEPQCITIPRWRREGLEEEFKGEKESGEAGTRDGAGSVRVSEMAPGGPGKGRKRAERRVSAMALAEWRW